MHIKTDYLTNIKEHDLFQILRMIEQYHGLFDLLSRNDKKPHMCLHSAKELAFPQSDISHLEQDSDGNYILHLNFMGLYGVDSPLPQFWIISAAGSGKKAAGICAFLNIFQQHLYQLLYAAWKKFKPIILIEQEQPGYLNYLQSLSGGLLKATDTTEYAYAGLLGQRVHNAEILTKILNDHMGGRRVTVKQFIPRWLDINQQNYLTHHANNGLYLHDNALLGNHVLDASRTILITIEMPLSHALHLLKDNEAKNKLWRLIKKYVGSAYQVEIVLKIIIYQLSILVLGKDNAFLGWGICIGSVNKKIQELPLSRIF